ncbi:MAG: type II toxin-antitoxin system HicA family toxin [Candidatus Eremiobacteraeota bacterium]|nr:type II toxin-antitoxin system HicA family toxin [Candidatus Eremiobacteraeota bacterium]
MTKLPAISGKKCMKALMLNGFYIKRREGSHIILKRDIPFSQLVVPDHKELDRGTLRAIIRQSGLSVPEFINLLQK